MGKVINQKELYRRAALVRQAIARGAGRFFGGAKLLYPISDYILLAFQKPICFSIWEHDGKMVYTTFRDPYIVSDSILSTGAHLKKTDYCKIDLSFLGANLDGYFATLHSVSDERFDPMGVESTSFLKQILDPNEKPKFPEGFSEALLKAIKANSDKKNDDSSCSNARSLTDRQVAKYLDPLRGVLDEVIKELLEHQSFSVILSNKVSIPNLFAVVRTVRSNKKRFANMIPEGIFPYTASLILSNTQRKLLHAICEDSGCTTCQVTTRPHCEQKQYLDRCISLLEAPLSSKARSIFDSVYYSGCVDYGLIGKIGEAGYWRDIAIDGGTQEDLLRREVEKCVYGVLTRGRNSRIMYVPIHIGGSPWMSFFTFTPAGDDSAWDDNYCFYRDVIAKLSDRIRTAAQDLYIKTLADDLKRALKNQPKHLFDEVNDSWEMASQVFPFRRPRLTQCSPSTIDAFRMPLGVYAKLTEEDNPFSYAKIDYGHVDFKRLEKTLATEIKLFELIDFRTKEGIRNRLTSQAHTFLNVLLSVQGTLDSSLRASDIETAHMYAQDAASNAEILEASLRAALARPLPTTFPMDLISMLNWLNERVSSGELHAQLSLNTTKAPTPFSNTKEVISAFTILWNLWDNAARVARGKPNGWFSVSSDNIGAQQCTEICFTNLGEMSEPWVHYINDQGPSPNMEKRPRGLEIVKELLCDLAWTLECQVGEGTTQINIRIPEDAPSK